MSILLQQTARQQQKPSQKLIQSASILQMNTLELEHFLKELTLENPLADYEDLPRPETQLSPDKVRVEFMDMSDYQNRYYYRSDKENPQDAVALTSDHTVSMADSLMSQLSVHCKDDRQRAVFYYLSHSLNDSGYLEAEYRELHDHFHLDKKEFNKAVLLLQSCDPPGIGARDLKECLHLQLNRLSEDTSLARQIVNECLQLIASRRWKGISQKFSCPEEDISRAIAQIQKLNPKPGALFNTERYLQYIHPEILIRNAGEQYTVQLTATGRLKTDPFYMNLLKSQEFDEKTRQYIGEKQDQILWYQKCVNQRNTTLLRLAKLIVAEQRDFFDHGIGRLAPFRMLDAAQALDIHVSTVSRAVKGKYLQCSYGVFPLEFFFPKGGSAANGKTVSSDRTKARIREILEQESPLNPLSDQRIAEILSGDGLSLSRRTVAKYRAEMGIPTANMR